MAKRRRYLLDVVQDGEGRWWAWRRGAWAPVRRPKPKPITRPAGRR